MIRRLLSILGGDADSERQPEQPDPVALALAVLLVELAQADHDHKESEETEILRLLEGSLELVPAQARELLADAKQTVEHSVSLHDFTRTLHERMDYAEKQRVIEMLWRIALADFSLDKYEDYMIGKIADLLYVSRGDVIRLKHRVAESIFDSDRDA